MFCKKHRNDYTHLKSFSIIHNIFSSFENANRHRALDIEIIAPTDTK